MGFFQILLKEIFSLLKTKVLFGLIGAILSPLFFLIHINNLSNIVALAIKKWYGHAHICLYTSGT